MELLVTIAVIGVLISLLLPAVQSAREAARRLQCMNNLKQVTLAVQNYESSHGVLPSSGDVELEPRTWGGSKYLRFNQNTGKQLSWVVFVLPYLEEYAVYDRFDLELESFLQPGAPQNTRLPSLICPSDSQGQVPFQHPTLTAGRPFAKGNYAAFCSPYHVEFQMAVPGALIGKPQNLVSITDGTSKTIVLSEIRTRDELLDERGAWALPWNGASLLAFDMHPDTRGRKLTDLFLPRGGRLYSTQLVRIDEQTQRPNTLGPNLDVIQECPDIAIAQLDGMPCIAYSRAHYLSSAPRSGHLGGVNASALDGSVRFLVDGIDPYTMAYLISINDGQRVSIEGRSPRPEGDE